jgi:1-deoxy-D-xylulose 5-phosphate reductoisomerase
VDEEAVALFLAGKIGLLAIATLIEEVLEQHQPVTNPDVPAILDACAWARRRARKVYEQRYGRMVQ